MSVTTLILAGMIELFIIAMAWIHSYSEVNEKRAYSQIMIKLIDESVTADEDPVEFMKSLLKDIRND